jgi:uncharacterized membrane protein
VNDDPNYMPRLHDGMRLYSQRGGFEHHGGGHHWLVLLFFVVLVVALLLIAISLARVASSKRATAAVVAGSAPSDDALSVLRLRYARGEVSREEFLLAHGDLGGGSPPVEAHPS